MKLILISLLFLIQNLMARDDHFVIQLHERSMVIESLDKVKDVYQVIIENQTLGPQIGKIMVGDKNSVFFKVDSHQKHAITVTNKEKKKVVFYPLSPAFQEAELIFQKKSYEIPSKK